MEGVLLERYLGNSGTRRGESGSAIYPQMVILVLQATQTTRVHSSPPMIRLLFVVLTNSTPPVQSRWRHEFPMDTSAFDSVNAIPDAFPDVPVRCYHGRGKLTSQ